MTEQELTKSIQTLDPVKVAVKFAGIYSRFVYVKRILDEEKHNTAEFHSDTLKDFDNLIMQIFDMRRIENNEQ